VPVCLLDEIRAGVPIALEQRKERWALIGLDPGRPLAQRKRKDAAAELLAVAAAEVERAAGTLTSEELERRRRTRVITPQRPHGEPAHYALVEAGQLVASHDPFSWSPDERYPKGVQEREYMTDKGEQKKVLLGAQQLDPALLLTDTPTAVDGPPLVTAGPVRLVMGGNGRSMMLKRAYAEEASDGA
jgi:hypothetical protein